MTLDMLLKEQRREGMMEEKIRCILNMANMHVPIDLIARVTDTTPEFVTDVIAKKDVDSNS